MYFAVDTPPTITVLSPKNQTYSTVEVDLNFTTSELASWMGYSLDGGENVTVTGNTTLSDLSEDVHTLTVYVNDTAGNMGVSETVYFSVDEPVPVVVWAVVAIVIVVVGGVGWWVYHRRGKEHSEEP
ncbi:MAG: hypothetical protein ACOC6G_00655 [Thermoproteota archaeon]